MHVTSAEEENPAAVFQLFSFPVHRASLSLAAAAHSDLPLHSQRGWVWNGAHQFRVAEGLPALWPQLRQKVGVGFYQRFASVCITAAIDNDETFRRKKI